MAHPRMLVRDEFVQLLADADTIAGDRVEPWRTDKYLSHQLPAIAIFTPGDERKSRSGTEERKSFTVIVRAIVADSASPRWFVTLDQLTNEIERAINERPWFTEAIGRMDTIVGCEYVSTEISPVQEDGSDLLLGEARITYLVEANMSFADEPSVDRFVTVDATHSLTSDPNVAPVGNRFDVEAP